MERVALKRSAEGDASETRSNSKRPKAEEDALQLDHRQKHPEHWDVQGNVIIQVEETLFRVHGPSLSRHSEQMNQLFGTCVEFLGGVPVHIVRGPSAKDFELLLEAIENPM